MLAEFSGYENVRSFTIDPSDTNRIYAGGAFRDSTTFENKMAMYRSTDGGNTWTKYDLTLPIHEYGYIYSIVLDPQHPSTVYAGGYYRYTDTTHAALFKSTDGGDNWFDLSSGLSGYSYTSHYIYDLEVDPKNDSMVYAATNQGIFKSTDWGASWHKKGSIYSVYSVVVSPNSSNRVFAGGYYGAYYSTDFGDNWNLNNQGLGCQYVSCVKFHPSASDIIYAGTYGGGLYCDTLEASGIEEEEEVQIPIGISLSQNYPNPFNPVTVIEYSLDKKSHVELSIYDLLGRKVKTLVNQVKPAGKHPERWDGTDVTGSKVATGVYFYRLKMGKFNESKKMVLLK